MDEADVTESSPRWGGLIELQPQQLVQIVLLGLGVGAAAWLLTLLIRQAILVPLFCGDPSNGICGGSVDIAGGIATVLAAITGLMGLVRLGIYRPLIIAVASAISLWGLSGLVSELLWFEALAWFALLYALCYAAFAWLVRPRSLAPVVVIIVIVVIAARWLPTL